MSFPYYFVGQKLFCVNPKSFILSTEKDGTSSIYVVGSPSSFS